MVDKCGLVGLSVLYKHINQQRGFLFSLDYGSNRPFVSAMQTRCCLFRIKLTCCFQARLADESLPAPHPGR